MGFNEDIEKYGHLSREEWLAEVTRLATRPKGKAGPRKVVPIKAKEGRVLTFQTRPADDIYIPTGPAWSAEDNVADIQDFRR